MKILFFQEFNSNKNVIQYLQIRISRDVIITCIYLNTYLIKYNSIQKTFFYNVFYLRSNRKIKKRKTN